MSGTISDAISGTFTPGPQATLTGSIADGLTGSLAASVDIELWRDGAITGTVEGTLAPSVEIMPFGTIDDALDGTLAPSVEADAGGVIEDSLDGTLTSGIAAAAAGVIEGTMDGTLAPSIEAYRTEIGGLRLDVGPPQGEPIASIFPVLKAELTWALNDIGSFSVALPVTAAGADRADAGMEARVIREGEGEIYRGLIASRRVVLEDDGPVIELEGYSTARELAYRTTQINWRIDAESLAAAAAALIADTGWSVTADAEVINDLVSAEFQGVTRFDAMTSLAQQVYRHVRPMPVERRIEITKGERDSGLRCMLLPEWPYGADDEDAILPIARIRVSRRDEDVVTRVIPVGAGEGPAALTLRWATRTSPYPIQTMVGPDGGTLYYLEDAAASATYGTRERVIAFKDVTPLANSAAELERAANVLYDLAAAWLQARTSPRVEWAVTVGGTLRLRDPLSGAWRLMPGDMVRLVARGAIDDWDGRRVFVDLDTDAFVREITRRWEGDAEEVDLTLTDTSRVVRDDDLLADVVDRVWAVAVAQKTVPVREIHGPFRQTLDASSPVRMSVDWDANVRFLHQAKLVIVCRRIRANATTAAAGGGQTTSAGTAHSHTVSGQTAQSGGGGTSSAGTSHSHALSGLTDSVLLGHLHAWATVSPTESWTDPPFRQQFVSADSGGNPFGFYVGRGGAGGSTGLNTDFVQQNHSHGVSGVTASNEASHTHTVPAHSHSVSTTTSSADTSHTHNVAAHTHALQYGIFEGTYPSGIALRVLVNGTDVTEALGGPWSPSEGAPLTLDITQWLQEPDGRPRQQANTVEVQGARLVDVELTVKSLIAIATVVPI
ncbi:MAG: hypothetical protein IRZ08_18765 [Frankia sp.]|nr:hypothetical protein [Frankia sp.]